MVASQLPATTFQLRIEGDGKVVFTGELTEATYDPNSGDRAQSADFSAVKAPGKYYIDVPGVGVSYPFEIGAEVYKRAYYLAMRFFYGQRCGTAVNLGPDFPQFHHDACHLEGAWHSSTGKNGPHVSAKGWHDAGDYGRYIVNSGITTATLLWTWELFADRVKNIALNIPESGKRTPDILAEIRWNLEWMLSMQDTDGGVYHKQTSETFPGFIMPEADKLVSYVIGTGSSPYKNTCATADFAAVMAIAGRTYRPYDAVFARHVSTAAENAWNWLDRQSSVAIRSGGSVGLGIPFNNPPGVTTGGYGDRNCQDEMLWASAELWRLTRSTKYESYFLNRAMPFSNSMRPPGWGDVAPLALWTYILGGPGKAPRLQAGPPLDNGPLIAAIKKATTAAAIEAVERTQTNPYRVLMRANDFGWGSNSQAANYGMLLLVADRIAPTPSYVEAAEDIVHYLLGRNTFSVSWVTGVGTNWYKNPHHRPSAADGVEEPWPGMLSGGPNRQRSDDVLQKVPQGTAPMKIWVDNQDSYAGNEVAINWNAPLVFLLAGMLP
jgi:endoglucanase